MVQKSDYKNMSAELEEILNRLQSGELSIDETLPAYERGMKLIKDLKTYMQTAETKITQLQAAHQD